MAMERWIDGQPEGNRAGVAMALTLIELYGDVPLETGSVESAATTPVIKIEKFSPEALDAEIERQVRRYQELGFHKRLKMSAGRFKDSVMGLVVPQPEAFRGRFDIPVVAFGQIPAKDQARLVGIDYWLEGLKVSDWEKDPQGYKTPEMSYLTWMQDGRVNLKRAPLDVRNSFATDERGATQYDGIGLYVARPQVLQDHYIDLPGTDVESGSVALLNLLGGGPELRSDLADSAAPNWGSASCGRT